MPLHIGIVDNDTLPLIGQHGYDSLGKVRLIMDYLGRKCKELYHPHCETAVDEAIIKFHGRSSIKQYKPKKPIKRGIKVWGLADSNNGYFYAIKVWITYKFTF